MKRPDPYREPQRVSASRRELVVRRIEDEPASAIEEAARVRREIAMAEVRLLGERLREELRNERTVQLARWGRMVLDILFGLR